MTAIALIELSLAVFSGILFISQFSVQLSQEMVSVKRLRICFGLNVAWLLIDALSYTLKGPAYPFGLRYSLNLLAYFFGCVILIFFVRYRDAYIREKTDLNPWLYRIPMIISVLCIVLITVEYVRGNIIEYENGIAVAVKGMPPYITVIQLIMVLYLPFVAFLKRKSIGMKAVVLFGLFDIMPLIAFGIVLFTGYDLTVILGALEFFLLVAFLQRERIMDYMALDKRLMESQTFVRFFLDTYVSAYYVDYEKLTCEVYKRSEELEKNYPIVTNYLDSLKEYAEGDVHAEDREAFLAAVSPENMRKMLKEKTEYTHVFRDISGNVEKIYRLQVIRGREKNHAAFGFIDISDEVKSQQERLNEAEEVKKLIEGIAATYNVAYAVNLANDTFKLIRMDEDIIGSKEHFDTFTEAKEFFFGLIPDSDKERMHIELDYDHIRERLAESKSYNVEYRVPINKAMIWHEMNVTAIDEDHVAIGFVHKDLEITQRHLEDKRFAEYFALYEIDIDSGMLKIVKDSPWYEIDRSGTAMPYSPTMLQFSKSLEGEARDFFAELADLNVVKERLATEDKYTYSYRSHNVGDNNWVECTSYVTLRHDDGSPAMFTYGFCMIDPLGVFRQELQSKYKDALEVVTEEKHRNDILHDIIHSGKWSVFIDADDKIIRSECSEESVRIVNNDVARDVLAWAKLIHPDEKTATKKAFYATIRDHSCNTPYDVTFRMMDKNGEYHWFHSAGRMVRNEDGGGEFFGILIDITAQIEEQLEQHRELEAAREAADAANRSKTNFLFNMSHDIRTPMNAIRGFTAMARKSRGDWDKVSEYLNNIDISGDQLLQLINQVLEMARFEAGKIELNEKPVDIREEFNSMVTVLSEQAKTNGLQFDYSLDDIIHNNVFADEARMGSVTLNIAGNAMKYTPEGGHIQFELKEIPARKDGYATFHFTVEDTGIGMSKEFLNELFVPFSRENNSTVSRIQGTGLGLAIVKNVIDLLGGDIKVQSELGKGTRFDITVDFKINDSIENVKENKQMFEVGSFVGKRILLVEDNEMNREIATFMLGEYGFNVETADDGDVAVSMVKEHFDRKEYKYYDCILMDIQMPRMNGYEATKEIRDMSAPVGIHIPIIAMTANAFEEDKLDALSAGMDDHSAKPIDLQKLLFCLAKYM